MTKILIDRATAEQALDALKEFGYHGSSPRWERTANALKAALEQQPVQEPTPWRDMVVVSLVREGVNKHKARELADHFATQPLPVQPEPLEYWNAVEGWGMVKVNLDNVKIDEVREHFNTVNCGMIYKHGGAGRVPLYTAPPQRPWVALTEQDMPNGEDSMFDHKYFIAGMVYAAKVLQEKNNAAPAAQPEQQAEPVACRFCHSKKGCWTWQCYKCGEIDDVQKPAPPPVQEPVAMLERNPRIGILKVTYEDAVTDLEEGVYALYTKPQGWRDHVAQAYLKGFDEGERRYRWLRKEFSEGRETYVAESVSVLGVFGVLVDRQMAKTSIKTQRWSGK